MNLLTLLAAAAAAHLNMPVDLKGPGGVQYTISCQLAGSARSGTLAGAPVRTESIVCYDPHDGGEEIFATFDDGGGAVTCASVPQSMYEPAQAGAYQPNWHYRSTCRATFTWNPGPRTCTSECLNVPWSNTGGNTRPTAFPNPLRVSQFDAMRFVNLPKEQRVRIYSLTGRLVYEGMSGPDGAMHWHLADTNGNSVGSGVYLVISGSEKLKIAVQR
jgi:hypothetical protein